MIFLVENDTTGLSVDNFLSIIAVSLSVIAIIVTVLCLFIQIRSSQHFDSKMKLFAFLVEDVYFNLSLEIYNLTFHQNIKKDQVRRVKTYIVEIRRKFSFLKYRNGKIFEKVNKIMLDLEDSILGLISKNNPINQQIEKVENNMKMLYETLDKYFKIDK